MQKKGHIGVGVILSFYVDYMVAEKLTEDWIQLEQNKKCFAISVLSLSTRVIISSAL